MCVSWNSKKSDEFPVSNAWHPPRWCALDCYWNKHFTLVPFITQMTYLTLLAPSPSAALHLILNTCLSFATSHNLIFNADKTQLIRFSHTPEALSTMQLFLHIASRYLQLTNSVKCLGHIILHSDDKDIVRVQKDLIHKAS